MNTQPETYKFYNFHLLQNKRLKRLKILKVEQAIRNKSDFLKNPLWRHGFVPLRPRYQFNIETSQKKGKEPSFGDTLHSEAKNKKNVCNVCREEATLVVHWSNLRIERYCDECFERDVNKVK